MKPEPDNLSREWLIMGCVLAFAFMTGFFVNTYSNKFESELQRESSGKHHQIAELTATFSGLEEDLRKLPRVAEYDYEVRVKTILDKINGRISERVQNHDFSMKTPYGNALTIVVPLVEDINLWLTKGIAGLPARDPAIRTIAAQRIYLAKFQLQKAAAAANQRTLDLLHKQSGQIRSFGLLVNVLIAGVVGLMMWAWLLYGKNRRDQAGLWNERKLTSASLDNINEGFVLTDASGRVLVVNQTMPSLSKKLAQNLREHTYQYALRQALADGSLIDESEEDKLSSMELATAEQLELKTHEGLYLRVTNRETGDGGRVITFTNITDLKQTQKKLHVQANYDYLTGIANRSYYVERLSEALAGAKRHNHKVALMQFDLDRFKQVNDTLGHAVGDELLKTTAERIKRNLRENDLAARTGGDEFAAILDLVKDEHEVKATAQRIVNELHQELEIDGAHIDFSASIGIAIFPDHATDIDMLIKHADIACYRAKDSGRNNYKFYGSDMKVQALELMTLESKLRKAIEKDELFLNYQPQMNLDSRELVMVEAFSRWHDTKLGNVSPDRFIPVADKNGLIAKLGEQVLEKSFAQLRNWAERDIDISIAVNLSKRQLFMPSLPETIDRLSSRYEVSPDKLALEVTEEVIADDWKVAAEKLIVLGDRGIKIIIDDYGMGTSSLSRINDMPIHALKIDGDFTKRICEDHSALDIVSAIISSAVNLRIDTIAENVETVEQVELLHSIGCTSVQGYFVGSPQTADEFATSYITNRVKSRLKKAG